MRIAASEAAETSSRTRGGGGRGGGGRGGGTGGYGGVGGALSESWSSSFTATGEKTKNRLEGAKQSKYCVIV